jgi:PAS domain S-box-containing protein
MRRSATRLWILAAVAGWSCAMGVIAWWHLADHAETMSRLARDYAGACYDKDLVYQRWTATHGDVLEAASVDRRLSGDSPARAPSTTAASDRVKVSVRSKAPTFPRQLQEITQNPAGIRSHIASLKTLNPDNAPDDWERAALKSLEGGASEASTIAEEGAALVARLMRPLYVEEACLRCHASQGYRLGEFRGGISITVPIDSIWAASNLESRADLITLLGLWSIGAAAIALAGKWFDRRHLERRNAAETLSRSERRFRAIYEQAPMGIALIDSHTGRFLEVNRRYADIVGRTLEEMLSLGFQDITHPDDLAQDLETMKQLLAGTSRRVCMEKRYYRGDGSIVWVHLTAVPMWREGDSPTHHLAMVDEITQRKRIEEELRTAHERLRASETKYRTLYRTSRDAIMTLTPEAGFLSGNPATIELFGCRDEREFTSTGPGDLSPECQPDGTPSSVKAQRMMATALERGSHFFEWTHKRRDGREFFATVLLTRVELEDQTLLQATVRDITADKQAAQALRESKEAAEAANRTKSEFLANMSHEIRTPMTAVLGYADLLLEQAADPASREAIQTIRRNGDHLLGIINDILDLSKIEAGRTAIHAASCSTPSIIAEVVSLMRVSAEAKRIPLNVEYGTPIPETILSDPDRLRQILINLVGNAVKFTEAGEVRIVVRLHNPQTREPSLQFQVVDTGIGMTPQDADRLFQPFSQVYGAADRKHGGTGLGLAISRRLARLLGGDIAVQSVLGKGSTFTLTVPTGSLENVPRVGAGSQARAAAQPATAEAAEAMVRLDCRILLAEDGPDNQRLISLLLSKAGAEVVIADNGRSALEQALAAQSSPRPFDIVLMDMQMPVMDGYEATTRLRAADYTRPIIALTAHAMAEDRQKCLDAGCDDYLTKPIDRAALFRTVARHATRRDWSCAASPPPIAGAIEHPDRATGA